MQHLCEVGNRTVVEAPFALLDEQVEVLLRNAVIASHMAFCLVPEVLDAVDMVCVVGKQFRMVDPHVVKLGYIQNVIGSEAVGVDDGIGPHLVPDDGKKRVRTGIWDDDDVDLAAAFEQAEHWHLACRSTPTLFPTYSWHQKLTLEVQTPTGVKSASTVNYVALSRVWTFFGLGYDRVYDFSGEALALDLAPGKVLFVLLSGFVRPSQEAMAWGVFKDLVPDEKDSSGNYIFEAYRNISKARETRVVPRKNYPLFLTFADLNDPRTFSIVDPDNLEATFGPGFSVKQMTLGITSERLTYGVIDPYIPWSKWTTRQWMEAGNGGSPMSIKIGEITQQIDSSSFRIGIR